MKNLFIQSRAEKMAFICEEKFSQIDYFEPDFNKNGMSSTEECVNNLNNFLEENFLDFTPTEMIRKYGKKICDQRDQFENWNRAFGYLYDTREKSYEKFKLMFGKNYICY